MLLQDKTPTEPPHADRIASTTGVRSAGSINNIVILGGPTLPPQQGINMFAYRADTGKLIDSTTLSDYTEIRKWLVVRGALYTGVENSAREGRVLRWKGSLTDPFQFDEVGNLPSMAAELAYHEGRLFEVVR